MSKSKATDKELGELHALLAKNFMQALQANDKATWLLARHGKDLHEDVVKFLRDMSEVNPSLLTAASKFLKDNDITCSIEDSKEMSDLQKTLAAKRARKTVGKVVPIVDED